MVALGGHAWDMTRYGDMINEQAVCILLECILVTSDVLSEKGKVLFHTLQEHFSIGVYEKIYFESK